MTSRTTLRLAAIAAAIAACTDASSVVFAPMTPVAGRTAALTQADGDTVMTHLLNPRGLAWGPEGALYVAEAGRGGTGPGCMTVLKQQVCYGATGAVSRLWHGEQERVISDLPSWVVTSNRTGLAEGPNGISFNGLGNAYVSIGLEADPQERVGGLKGMGSIIHLLPSALSRGQGKGHDGAPDWEFAADLGTYEVDANPDCGDLDSNPFGILAIPGGVLVPDAGANAIVQMDANGDLSTFAAFSNNTTVPGPGCPAGSSRDFVPTSITVGPDGAYYIGHLNGLPILAGSSSIWRMEPGGTPTKYCTGFTWIVALAFDASGNAWVLQHSVGPLTNSGGSLIRVAPDCTQSTVVTGLTRATGVAVDDEGHVYISLINGSNFAGEGQVRRFTPGS